MTTAITRVYIAGPINGHEGYEAAFAAKKAQLTELGYEVETPLDLNPPGFDHTKAVPAEFRDSAEYKRLLGECFAAIHRCDAVQLLPGWEYSSGATKEAFVAEWTGKQVWLPNFTPPPVRRGLM